MTLNPLSTDDFALLHAGNRSLAERSRRTALWLAGMALLFIATVLALVWYLHRFEVEEAGRRRSADAQWLEQSVQFHFRRLEDDLAQRARQIALGDMQGLPRPGEGAQGDAPAGLLWRAAGVVTAQVWHSGSEGTQGDEALWQHDRDVYPGNARALSTLQDVAANLRRASYAGPMQDARGAAGDRVWLAIPTFDGGRLVGLYLVALSMRSAVAALLPAWFTDSQEVRLVADVRQQWESPDQPGAYRTVMNLPGTELMLEAAPRGSQTSPIPRLFFAVAMVFLLGMVASLAALRRDFAKRQQVQQRLQAEIALRSAMERSVSLGMRAWDMQGTVLYVNQAFCAMVGYSAGELLGARAPLPYWPDDQNDELATLHRGVLARGTQEQGIETQFQHRDGHRVDVLIQEAPLMAADGAQIGWMSSVLDISARKRAEQLAAQQQEKLDASERLVAVGEVASTLAHELNQPLGALASFANGLLNRLRVGNISLPEMQPVVQRIADLAERAGGVTQRVNAFARKRELHLVQVDLVALVRRAAAAAQEGRGTPVALDLPAPPVMVQGDALLLEHLVHNLCANALDWASRGAAAHGPARVRLRVLCPPHAREVRVEVADSGPGVAPSAMARLFDAFFSTKDGGMGMGLAICRSIAEAHHGRIEVAQDPELGGALFVALLPLSDAPQGGGA